MTDETRSWRHAEQVAFVRHWQDALRQGLPENEVLTLVSRLDAAFDFLDHDGGHEDPDKTTAHAISALQAVGFEFDKRVAPWIDRLWPGDRDTHDRLLLKAMIKLALHSLSPKSREDDEIILVPLPARYASRVSEALDALDYGDQKTIFEPSATGKHTAPYQWARARRTAVLHVAFLNGGGKSKQKARKVVGAAIGASVNTLRDWERSVQAREIEAAHDAGQIEQRRLDLGEPHPNPIDANASQMIEQLSGRLPAFARQYRDEFGARHWGGDGD